MNREQLEEKFDKFKNADEKYQDFINRFIEIYWNGKLEKKSERAYQKKDLQKQNELREARDNLLKEYEEAKRKFWGEN